MSLAAIYTVIGFPVANSEKTLDQLLLSKQRQKIECVDHKQTLEAANTKLKLGYECDLDRVSNRNSANFPRSLAVKIP